MFKTITQFAEKCHGFNCDLHDSKDFLNQDFYSRGQTCSLYHYSSKSYLQQYCDISINI